LKVSNI